MLSFTFRPNATFRRILRFAGIGMCVGAPFALYILAIGVLSGAGNIIIKGQPVPALPAAALYLVAGAIGGAIIGVLYPLARNRVASALIGVLTLVPVGMGIGLIEGQVDLGATLFLAVAVGAPTGVVWHAIFLEEE